MIKIRIDLETIDKMVYIPNDKNEFFETWMILLEKGFIFNEFILIIDRLTQSYKVTLEKVNNDQLIKIRKNQYDDYGILIKQVRKETTITKYLEELVDFIKDLKSMGLKEMYKKNSDFMDVLVPMQFMQWLLRESKKRTFEFVEPKEKTKKSGTKPKKSTTKTNKQEYTLLDCIKIYRKNLNGDKREYTRHTEGWDVRGYWRHNKNGTVTYIAPYQKGKNRTKTERNYKI